MENDAMNTVQEEPQSSLIRLYQKIQNIVLCNRYLFGLSVCLILGIIFGCVTQSIYGSGEDWQGMADRYCAGFLSSFNAVAPVTVAFVAAIFAVAPFEYLRLLIYPAEAVRAMGLGTLLCGAVQYGSLRELGFASMILLPYAAVNCVICVYAGEYALGWRNSFTSENEGMTRSLILHTGKMILFYIGLASLSCVLFAASCQLFRATLI